MRRLQLEVQELRPSVKNDSRASSVGCLPGGDESNILLIPHKHRELRRRKGAGEMSRRQSGLRGEDHGDEKKEG